jgi:hypothetical protein
MLRMSGYLKAEWRRWKRLFRVLTGRGVDPVDTEPEATDMDTHEHEDVVASVAAMTAERERESERALNNIRQLFHDADQPMTVAKAKASMLKRAAGH